MLSLSIVNIIPDLYKDKINELAEVLGKGFNNIDVKLQNNEGQIFWGCHSWWSVNNYIMFKDLYALSNLGIDTSEYAEAISYLYESIINTKTMKEEDVSNIPYTNWIGALSSLNLSLVVEAGEQQ